MAFLTPNRITALGAGGCLVTVKDVIIPDSYRAPKDVASYVRQGWPLKPCAPLSDGAGPRGITVHNTGDIATTAGTNPAEQYCRATYNGNMGGVVVHYYVWRDEVWQLLDNAEQGWHAADGTARRVGHRSGIKLGGNLDTIAIEAIGSDAKTEAATAKLAACLCRAYGLDPALDIYTHNWWMHGVDAAVPGAAKNCPVYILPHWPEFLAQAASWLSELEKLVRFLGGPVYASSDAEAPAAQRKESLCRLTRTVPGAAHPHHVVSMDAGGVYGWVNDSAIAPYRQEGSEKADEAKKENAPAEEESARRAAFAAKIDELIRTGPGSHDAQERSLPL